MINYDTISGVSVQVSSLSSRSLHSVLTINSVTMSHAGRYSCSPSKVRPDTVIVRVENREEGAPEPVVNRGRRVLGCDCLVFVYIPLLTVGKKQQ